MIYIRGAELKEARDEGTYPFSVRAALEIDRIRCETPFTILTGGNGCGKTTVMRYTRFARRRRGIGNARSAKADRRGRSCGRVQADNGGKGEEQLFLFG